MCQTICDITSSNVRILVQCEQKVWDRGAGLVYTSKGGSSLAVYGFGCKNPSVGPLDKWPWKTVISPHKASMQCSSVIY